MPSPIWASPFNSGHSLQDHADTVEEVRRILLIHLAAVRGAR
jgi:hypothetical protein